MRKFEKYCCEDLSLIENYEKAKADDFKGWHCHHRLETDNDCFRPTRQQLIDNGLYYDRPASELIFMKVGDHRALHMKKDYEVDKGIFSKEAFEKISKSMTGKHKSKEHKKKLSESLKGQPNLALKGKHLSEEHRKKLSEAHKGKVPWNKKIK